MLPEFYGVIQTEDGALGFLTLQGRTFWANGKERQLLSVVFESEDKRYGWLNNTCCVLEGTIDSVALTMTAHVYSVVSDMV